MENQILEMVKPLIPLVEDNTTQNAIWAIATLIVSTLTTILVDFFRKHLERKKEERELDALKAVERKTGAETLTEEAQAAEINVKTSRSLMEEQRLFFEVKFKEMQTKHNEEISDILKRLEASDGKILLIQAENERIRAENQKIESENWKLHQENQKLNSVIIKLQTAIKGLKDLIKKLMLGINKVISAYEANNVGEIVPWKPILTDDEQLLLQSDFDFKDLEQYKK